MRSSNKEIISWLKSIILAAGIAIVIKTFLFSPYIVEGKSMEPTLHDHEKIMVNKVYGENSISRGDIVIIKGSEKNYVKRIIGIPGDLIEMKNDLLYINGKLKSEMYLAANLTIAQQKGSKLTEDMEPFQVPKGHYFVMGDNRSRSTDSRNGLGFIEQDKIIGKSEFVFLPFENFRKVK